MSVSTESKLGLSDKADVVTWDLSMTPKTESHLNQLARDIGGSREDVLRLAVALLTSGSGAADRSMPNTNAGWLSMLFGGGFLSAAGMALRRRK